MKYRVTMNNCSKRTATNITLLTLNPGLDSHLDGLLDKCRHQAHPLSRLPSEV